ncbi:MAG: hypothetical protein HY583_03090 [Candidatus Omnitrophica bacterium]|nr:hypothetical protein [Candidatus Omnitrophota bacterium]
MKTKAPAEMASELISELDAAHCGSLPLEESVKAIESGELILQELRSASENAGVPQQFIEDFSRAIELAKGAIGYETLPK